MANLYTVSGTGWTYFRLETRDFQSAIQTGREMLTKALSVGVAQEFQVWRNGSIMHLENNYKALVKDIDMGDYSEDFDYAEGG